MNPQGLSKEFGIEERIEALNQFSQEEALTGGCQCGAIRWRASAKPRDVHHCHCGMCRRWTGAAFATLVWFKAVDLQWQGEAPTLYRSSPIATRSHCAQCGTPLALIYDARDDIAVTIGTLDHPAAVTPSHHYGSEGRLPWADIGAGLPTKTTKEKW
jgi:hypothetical protein